MPNLLKRQSVETDNVNIVFVKDTVKNPETQLSVLR